MTFENAIEDWESHDDWRYADRDAERKFFYLAGQASAEQRVKWQDDLIQELQAKCAELERERDQWKYTAEIRQQHLEYTIKAQAGEQEPVELTWELLETKPKLYLHPTTERRVIPAGFKKVGTVGGLFDEVIIGENPDWPCQYHVYIAAPAPTKKGEEG